MFCKFPLPKLQKIVPKSRKKVPNYRKIVRYSANFRFGAFRFRSAYFPAIKSNQFSAFENVTFLKIEVSLGDASKVLDSLLEKCESSFDLVLIDCDNKHVGVNFEKSLKLTKPGGIIVIDGVLCQGFEYTAY